MCNVCKWKKSPPSNLEEVCDYIIECSDSIPVREELNGKWGGYYLTELPVKLALKNALKFIKEGRIPVAVIKHEL